MEKRQQRTPAEIIAETEARLERLRLRQAQKAAKTNPALSPLMEEKADLTKEIREAKKILGSGPQSAEQRIVKHNVWIAKINDEGHAAVHTLAEANKRMAEINTEISRQVDTLLETPKEKAQEA
jgi:predicted component of type VI protein secretion system